MLEDSASEMKKGFRHIIVSRISNKNLRISTSSTPLEIDLPVNTEAFRPVEDLYYLCCAMECCLLCYSYCCLYFTIVFPDFYLLWYKNSFHDLAFRIYI